jgi:AcrR family transcriptional regulator
VAKDRGATATHAALLDAAEQLFSDQGFKETSVAQIAQRTGVSRASFYVYSSSRDEVFRDDGAGGDVWDREAAGIVLRRAR